MLWNRSETSWLRSANLSTQHSAGHIPIIWFTPRPKASIKNPGRYRTGARATSEISDCTIMHIVVTHRLLYTQMLLHTDSFTHRRFQTQKLLHTEAFTHRRFGTQTLLHTDAFTQQTPLHTDAFTHRHFYTQTPLHTDAFTHKPFLHTDTFTHRSL